MANDSHDTRTLTSEESCPDCENLVTASDGAGLCDHCGRVFAVLRAELLSREPPPDVALVPFTDPQGNAEHPYRAVAAGERTRFDTGVQPECEQNDCSTCDSLQMFATSFDDVLNDSLRLRRDI